MAIIDRILDPNDHVRMSEVLMRNARYVEARAQFFDKQMAAGHPKSYADCPYVKRKKQCIHDTTALRDHRDWLVDEAVALAAAGD